MIKHMLTFAVATVLVAFILPGCKKETPTTTGGQSPKRDAGSHVHDDGTVHSDHDDATAAGGAGHGGAIIELGTATIGPFSVRASRDKGEIKAGGDVPIDVWLTGGDIAKVTAVRFWIGTEQGDQFVKAKAEIEIPSEPNHWHTHAEVPNPIPAGAQLWVEIEIDGQGKHVGSLDLEA